MPCRPSAPSTQVSGTGRLLEPHRCFLLRSGCAPVLVDQSAEDLVATDRSAERDHGSGVVGGRVLIQALVRAVVIEMAHVAVKNNSGVSFVVDQQPVGAFGADAADEPVPRSSSPGAYGEGSSQR